MELADLLTEKSVIILSGSTNKDEVLRNLSQHAAKVTGEDAEAIFTAINDREQLGSTGLGNGIAIPHGRFVGLPAVTAVFAKLTDPVDFESIDDQPVDLVVMLLAPVGAGADHLKALARVARVLRNDDIVAALRNATDPARLHAILTMSQANSRAA